jgi:hypothetical protein
MTTGDNKGQQGSKGQAERNDPTDVPVGSKALLAVKGNANKHKQKVMGAEKQRDEVNKKEVETKGCQHQ